MKDSGLKSKLIVVFIALRAIVNLMIRAVRGFAVEFASRFRAIGRFLAFPVTIRSITYGFAHRSLIDLELFNF